MTKSTSTKRTGTNKTGKQQIELWSSIIGNTLPTGMLCAAMRHTAYNLSDMLRRPVKVSSLRVETVPINQLALHTTNPEAETVGVYLLSGDDLPGQAILMLSLDDAMYMTDWLLEARPGTTTRLGDLERSALAETGNLVLSSFLNAVAEFSGRPLRLSPPAVMVDMLATILQVAVTPAAAITDEVLIIETDFLNVDSALLMRFWVLPDPAVLTANGNQTGSGR